MSSLEDKIAKHFDRKNSMRGFVIKSEDIYGTAWALVADVSGYGNGYVIIPRDHPYWGLDYDDVQSVKVHGGFTFAAPCKELKETDRFCEHIPVQLEDGWVFGFDTQHSDSKELFPDKESVIREIVRVMEQFEKVYKDAINKKDA